MNLLRRCFNNRLRLFADLKDWKMIRTYALTLAFVFVSSLSNAQDSLDDQTRAMIARASSLELKTKSVPPPDSASRRRNNELPAKQLRPGIRRGVS